MNGEEGVAFKVTTRVLLFVPYTTEVTYARSRQEQKQIEEKKVKRKKKTEEKKRKGSLIEIALGKKKKVKR